jgi:hypothetical protein
MFSSFLMSVLFAPWAVTHTFSCHQTEKMQETILFFFFFPFFCQSNGALRVFGKAQNWFSLVLKQT